MSTGKNLQIGGGTIRSLDTSTGLALTAAVVVVGVHFWLVVERARRSEKPSSSLSVDVECCCGQVRFAVNAKTPVHLVCYCDDCQAYVRWLEKQKSDSNPGKSVRDDNTTNDEASSTAMAITTHPRVVVDANGGSRTCQVYQSDVRILKGKDLLAITYLDPSKVPSRPQRMYRVHSKCCLTPMCSAVWKELPVMGLYAGNFKKQENENNNASSNRYLQPNRSLGVWDNDASWLPAPEYRINCAYAKQQDKEIGDGDAGFPIRFLLRFMWRNFVVGPKMSSIQGNDIRNILRNEEDNIQMRQE